jgi:hypothetical protein
MKDEIMKDGIMKEEEEKSTTREEDAISAIKFPGKNGEGNMA